MSNEIWRTDPEWLMAYTECPDVISKIKRSYPDFKVSAEYFKAGQRIGVQYKVPSRRKRSAIHLLKVNVSN